MSPSFRHVEEGFNENPLSQRQLARLALRGTGYKDDSLACFAFVEFIDSLFDEKVCRLCVLR